MGEAAGEAAHPDGSVPACVGAPVQQLVEGERLVRLQQLLGDSPPYLSRTRVSGQPLCARARRGALPLVPWPRLFLGQKPRHFKTSQDVFDILAGWKQ